VAVGIVKMSHRSFLDLKTKEPILDLPFLTEMVLLDSKSRFSLVYASAHPPAEELLRPLTPSSIRHAPSADGEDLDERGKGEAGGRRREEKTGEEGRWWIRANQGHSIKVDKLEDSMKKVESVEDAGDAVHGTRRELWDVICELALTSLLARCSRFEPCTLQSFRAETIFIISFQMRRVCPR
jgi:hypothetical protein